MEKNSIFTSYHRKLLAVSLLVGVLILLAGCSGDFSPIDESTTGFFNQKIVYPFSLLIKWLASKLSGSYGLSIIVITIALRLVILPFMVRQQVQGQENQVKMKVIQIG